MKKFLRYDTIAVLLIFGLAGCKCLSSKITRHQELTEGTLIKEIREKGTIWSLIHPEGKVMIGNTLYVDDRWEKEKVGVSLISDIIHENVHAQRQEEVGLIWWMTQYLFNSSFRLDEEMLAREAEWRYKFSQRWLHFYSADTLNSWLDAEAKSLSGPVYFYSIEYTTAKERITEVLRQIYKENNQYWPEQ